MKKIILLFALFSTTISGVFAQHANWCGTEISSDWMQAFYQRDKDHLSHKAGELELVVIPITYHIVGTNNGFGYYSLAELFRAHCELQSLYSEANITFYIKDIEYINNTDFYDGVNTFQLFIQENDATSCNVFIVDNMDGVCGYSYVPEAWDGSGWSGPNRGGVMLQKGCMESGNTTYRHEMGHYLNLPHTFFGWEGEAAPGIGVNAPNTIGGVPVEKGDGSNCAAAGDGFCDTPPDYLSDRWNCNVSKAYNDPNGLSVTMDEKNFMSYSNDGCSTYLKEDQLAEVNAAAANHRPYLLIDPIPTFDIIPLISGLEPTVNTNYINTTNLNLSWDATNNASYYHVQLSPYSFNNPLIDTVVTDTFFNISNLSSNTYYEWRVKPVSFTNVCSPFSDIMSFNTASFAADVVVTNSSCPSTTDGSIVLTLPLGSSYSYYWTSDDPSINSNIQNLNTNMLTGLPPENYNVTIVRQNGDSLQVQASVLAPQEITISIDQFGETLNATILGGAPPYSYVWDNGAETLTLSDISNGDYTLIVVDQNGCQKTATGTFDSNRVGVRENQVATVFNMLLTPNPTKGTNSKLSFTTEKSGSLQYVVTDIQGKVLLKQTTKAIVGENNLELKVGNFSKGIYLVNVQFEGRNTSRKLLIQ